MLFNSLAAELRTDAIEVTPLLVQGSTVDTLIDEARKLEVALIVAGSHDHGAAWDLVVGSFSARIIRHAPVVVVPAEGSKQ